ncbi:mucin-7-like [Rhipicephalus sanguineus]|uniref:mucin-7-like n=1 Tax=Rhipicephalus sanguineus TaxID=34632 RepID=UPI001895D126|nr:mucin-7-like [Rhipicephalus sanguineus]
MLSSEIVYRHSLDNGGGQGPPVSISAISTAGAVRTRKGPFSQSDPAPADPALLLSTGSIPETSIEGSSPSSTATSEGNTSPTSGLDTPRSSSPAVSTAASSATGSPPVPSPAASDVTGLPGTAEAPTPGTAKRATPPPPPPTTTVVDGGTKEQRSNHATVALPTQQASLLAPVKKGASASALPKRPSRPSCVLGQPPAEDRFPSIPSAGAPSGTLLWPPLVSIPRPKPKRVHKPAPTTAQAQTPTVTHLDTVLFRPTERKASLRTATQEAISASLAPIDGVLRVRVDFRRNVVAADVALGTPLATLLAIADICGIPVRAKKATTNT